MKTLPSFVNYHPADEDRQKETVEPTAAGLTPPQVQGQTDDDFHRGELQKGFSVQSHETGKETHYH
jgi:hypothetical protein